MLYRLSVRVVSSERAGSGKSLVVRRLSESLLELANNCVVTSYPRDMEADEPLCISVPIYGPAVDQCVVVESLLPHVILPDLPLSRIFHLDVHPSVIIALLNNRNFLWSLNISHVSMRVKGHNLRTFESHKNKTVTRNKSAYKQGHPTTVSF